MRINKYLTEHGYCSRREADRLIEDGKIFINGKRATLGAQVEEDDEVRVGNTTISEGPQKVYIMYNKPVGVTCTTDPSIKGNIVEAVNHPFRVFPIGRLDKDSNGLIFLTNDGDIVNKILRAQFGHEKEYVVDVDKPITDTFIERMSKSVKIGAYRTRPCKVKKLDDKKFMIILTEGKNRQIRRMCNALDYEVTSLQRTRIMNVLLLPNLKPGMWKPIPKPAMKVLRELIEKKNETNNSEDWNNSEE